MKVYSAGWYNYIAQETQHVKIEADNIIQAKEAMILYMNNRCGSSTMVFHEGDIEFCHEDDLDCITYHDEIKKYKEKFNADPPKDLLDWEDKEYDIYDI